jgi:ribosomal protein S27AE
MIDLVHAVAESKEWGIPLREWMELRAHVYGNIDPFGEYREPDDEKDEEWRGRVADVLIENRLFSKANRYVQCYRYGNRFKCKGKEAHELFAPISCDLRYCPRCGPQQFMRLIRKYSPVVKFLASKRRRGLLLREITLTTRKTGTLTPEQIKKFNDDVKKTLKKLMKGNADWGAIWCDEVGFNNTNLHAHILFYGPYIDQSRLAEVWRQVSGHEIVFIKKTHTNGPEALIHLFKYVSKPPADDPKLIGQLEVAFHGRRRVHALGVFYNFVGEEAEDQKNEWKTCPHCGAELERQPGAVRLETLILEGRTFIGSKHTERKRKWVN